MTRIAIIPARGGSKRLPHKNIMPFEGRPMIAWTIEAALGSELFDRVLVSTDDEGIAEASCRAGAEVPFLRDAHADDHSPVSEATLRALRQAEDHWSTSFGTVVQLMANCPLRTAADITDALTHFDQGAHDFQISAFEFGWMNPWWAMRRKPDGSTERLFENLETTRSQDLETLYCPTGAIWIANTAELRAHGTFYGPGLSLCPMPWESAVDIDDEADLRMATATARMRAALAGQ